MLAISVLNRLHGEGGGDETVTKIAGILWERSPSHSRKTAYLAISGQIRWHTGQLRSQVYMTF